MNDPILFGGGQYWWMSNFSAFRIHWNGVWRFTSEHIYQAAKFESSDVRERIYDTLSPYDAKKLAEDLKSQQKPDWYDIRDSVMEDILRAKAGQHPYVLRKLLATGNRLIIENSPTDNYWGNGPDGTGKNMLGKIWMKVREHYKDQA